MRRWNWLLPFLAGALLNCAFAPLNIWPLAVICPAVLLWQWEGDTPRVAWTRGFAFGMGLISAGTWWLYLSIRGVAHSPLWLTALVMIPMWMIMATYYGLVGLLGARLLPRTGPVRWLLGIPALWTLLEWLRGWLFTGFPWLSLGFSQTDTWLSGFAPVLGVYGLSWLLMLCAGAVLMAWRAPILWQRGAAVVLLLVLWPAGLLLARVEWTVPVGAPVTVAVAQGAVEESIKWDESSVQPTLDLYQRLNTQALGARLIVWPESALPVLANEAVDYLRAIRAVSLAHNSEVVLGILQMDESQRVFNSVMALGPTIGLYNKHHLVPFGEYFPVPHVIREWMRLANLPYSDFESGSDRQPPLQAAGTSLAVDICYEDGFPGEGLAAVGQAELLANVTNDGWFGRSWARYQHLQISRMRALVARKSLIRAANDGVSVLIGERGQVLARAAEFQPTVLRGEVQPRRGVVPFIRLGGNLPVLLWSVLCAAAAVLARWKRS